MKDILPETLEAGRPNYSARHCIDHALNALYEDRTKCLGDEVAKNLTYEELIGTLLLARDITQ